MRAPFGIAAIMLLLLAGGCAGVAPRSAVVAPPGPAGPGELPAPPGVRSGPRAAVVALVDDAERQARAGRPALAAASLERALRIDPGDAALWQRLARLRLTQGQYEQAEQLARRSLLAAGADRASAAAAWRIIAAARRGEGDAAGARRAAAQADALSGR